MIFLETKNEKKSFLITVAIYALMFLIFFVFGLHYMYPPKERGIAVNFGTSKVGKGALQSNKNVNSAPVQSTPQPKASTETPHNKSDQSSSSSENVQRQEKVETQDTKEAPVINQKKEKKEPQKETHEVQKEKKKSTPKKKEEPKPDKSTSQTLENILNGKKHKGNDTRGEGNDQVAGDKGDINGNPNAHSYYGQGTGLDGDGNYRLGGRLALNKKTIKQNCNEYGKVVVKIKVNRQGKVVKAVPGVKIPGKPIGTTNTAPCLLKPSKKAALATKFNKDSKAPSIQTGYIVYDYIPSH